MGEEFLKNRPFVSLFRPLVQDALFRKKASITMISLKRGDNTCMKFTICSHDPAFHGVCRFAVETWADTLGVDTEISITDRVEELFAGGLELLLLDADSLFQQESSILEENRDSADTLFLCTRESRQAIRCYSLRPSAFFGKAFSAMSRCVARWKGDLRSLEVMEIRSRVRIPLCEILWAEAMGNRSLLHGMRREVQVSESLNDLAAMLPGEVFVRCQRSYMVNLYHVKSLEGKDLVMTDGSTVSVGRALQADVQQALAQFWARCLSGWETGE